MIIPIFYKNPQENFSWKCGVFWIYATVGKGSVDIWKTEGSPNAFYECILITMQLFLITKMTNFYDIPVIWLALYLSDWSLYQVQHLVAMG